MYTDGKSVWGIYIMEDNTKVYGRYFGISVAPETTDKDKYVFLPAAGGRNGSGYDDVGIAGSYWSAAFNANNTSSAYTLKFYSGSCGVYSYGRNYGRSIRCVRDK